jgi:hypothetical protein
VTSGKDPWKNRVSHLFAQRSENAYGSAELIALPVATGNCNPYSGVGDPYLPFRGALGMLTGAVEGAWAASVSP